MLHFLRNRLAGRLARTVAVCGLAFAVPLAAQEAEETSELPFLLSEESDSAEYDLAPLDDFWIVESTEIDGEKGSICFEKNLVPLADAGLPSGECSGNCSTTVRPKPSRRRAVCDPEKPQKSGVHPDCPMGWAHRTCKQARRAGWAVADAKCQANGGKDCVCWASELPITTPESRCKVEKQTGWTYCKYECTYAIKGNCGLYPSK
jgi:hypothetical protein